MAGKNGGRRKGAGRPKGSTSRPSVRDFFTKSEIKLLVEQMKDRAVDSDKIAIFLAEQIFGRAIQPVTGEDGGPIKVDITSSLDKFYGRKPS